MIQKVNNRQTVPAAHFIQYISLFLLLSITLFLTGCQKKAQIIPDHLSELNAENAATQLVYYSEDLLLQELGSDTINLHYLISTPAALGIQDYQVSLGHYGAAVKEEQSKTIRTRQQELKNISYQNLVQEDQLTCDVMNWYFDHALALCDYPYFDEPLDKTIGIQTQLPILLAEYQFRTITDVEDYLGLLDQMDAYLQELVTYEQEKSAAGLFMADFAADHVIASCQAFLADKQNHYLIRTFEERIHTLTDLSSEQMQSYCDQNRTIVTDKVFPAYENLIQSLTALKGSGKNNGGLCQFEKGADYYEKLIQLKIGTDKSASVLTKEVDQQIEDDLNSLAKILQENGSILENINNLRLQTTDANEILKDLQSKISTDFPAAPDCSYTVKNVSENLQSVLSPAFYLTPPLDLTNENTIYLNPFYTTEDVSLFTTLAHEGFPGHLYQNLFTASCSLPPVRSLFSFQGYSEGYATYAEYCSYDYLGFDKPVCELLKLSNRITLGLYAKLDLAIHSLGWSLSETSDYLLKYGITDTNAIAQIYQTIIEQPGNYLAYYAGYLQILKLKKEASDIAGNDFSLLNFHQYLLSTGEAPFPVLEKYLKLSMN